ncbi:lipocalin family protein [Methylomarinum sp. Ch1-1]|uniref:Outer membrane lipoprotein Blc n=1 Tax=Methylomarinum roseum TaxID=3067653 RepID=A0AAU7NXQ0_9GAMM|nr:lipocalin family protein [Methylomarinum sp. Ch1-1]MDP4522534.1 lipocalin family protein [Methylomarinum sp. Ch1-1]
MKMKPLLLILLLALTGCTGIPEGIEPVKQFDVQRYLGKWYEIARLDHRFERGLTAITAEYSLREDGGIRVVNSGYNVDDGQLEQAEGRAYFIGANDVGSLKVSFFGPFYGGYHIIELDKEAYRYAMITGPDRDYLWILARTPDLAPAVLNDLIARAKTLGFAVDQLIFTEHDQSRTP